MTGNRLVARSTPPTGGDGGSVGAPFDPHAWCAQRNAMMQRRDIEWFVDGINPKLRYTAAAVARQRADEIRREEESIRQHRAGLAERDRKAREVRSA